MTNGAHPEGGGQARTEPVKKEAAAAKTGQKPEPGHKAVPDSGKAAADTSRR